MSVSYKVITPPSIEPVTLYDIKQYLRLDFPDDDNTVQQMTSRARSLCETVTGRAFATQTVQAVFTIERPEGGELSGRITQGPNWYQYQQQLGANPFGASQFYFDLPMSPVQGDASTITVQTKVTAFDAWTSFPYIVNGDGSTNLWLDNNREPARMYFSLPVTANFWQFQYTAGYSSSYPLPPDLAQCLYEGIAYFYEFREAQDFPAALTAKLSQKRLEWI